MWFCLKSGFRAFSWISRKNRDFRRPWAKYWDFKCTRWAAPSVCTLKSLFFAMGALWALEIHVFCKEVHMRAPMAKFWDLKVHTEGTHEGRLSDWFECMLLWYDSLGAAIVTRNSWVDTLQECSTGRVSGGVWGLWINGGIGFDHQNESWFFMKESTLGTNNFAALIVMRNSRVQML